MSKKIRVYKGDEHRPKIETEFNEDDIFAEVYRKARKLLKEIVEETTEEKGSSLQLLQQARGSTQNLGILAGNNIILFTADRGQGKTSAMMSVANAICSEDGGKGVMKGAVGKEIFYLTDCIDPSAMDSGEDIIRVLLSRLFFRLNKIVGNDNNKAKPYDAKNREKVDKLLKCFRECYENLDSMERRGLLDEYGDDLEKLAKLGDSANLKANLFELFDRFLNYVDSTEVMKYLVVPIDDVDLCMGDVLRVCERIHNFLALPNVIILMAIDYAQLGRAVYQKYLERHASLLQIKKIDMIDECYSLAMKYLEKIFPGSHHIDLPIIDELLTVQEEQLYITYGKKGDDEQNGIAFKEGLSEKLYRRTGIVLLTKQEELQPFLPRTMRELNYFVKMLEDMAEVDFELVCGDIYGVMQQSEKEKHEQWQEQIALLRENVRTVKQYFMEYWCTKHLDAQQYGVINNLDESNHSSRMNIDKNVYCLNEYLGEDDTQTDVIRANNYQELMYGIDTNSRLLREYDFRQGLFLYYTFFLQERFLTVLETPQKMNSFLNFIGNVIYYPSTFEWLGAKMKPVRGLVGKKQGLDGFLVTAFDADVETFKHFWGKQDNVTPQLKKWVDIFCRSGAEDTEIIEPDKDKGQDVIYRWNPRVKTISFDILRPFMRLLQDEAWGKTLQTVKDSGGRTDTNSVQSNGANDEKEKEEVLSRGRLYIVAMKNILTNCEIQKEIREDVDYVSRRLYMNPQGATCDLVSSRIYGAIEQWSRYAPYLEKGGLADAMRKYWNDISQQYGYFEKLFLSNEKNLKRYVDEYKASLDEGKRNACKELKELADTLNRENQKKQQAAVNAEQQAEAVADDTRKTRENKTPENLLDMQSIEIPEDYEKAAAFRPQIIQIGNWGIEEKEDNDKIKEMALLEKAALEAAEEYQKIRQTLKEYQRAERTLDELILLIKNFIQKQSGQGVDADAQKT